MSDDLTRVATTILERLVSALSRDVGATRVNESVLVTYGVKEGREAGVD